jgi:lysyl-tRNA synthetase class 2
VWSIAVPACTPARPPRAPFLLSLVATAAGLAGLLSVVTPTWAGRLQIVSELLSPAAPHVADGLLVAASLGLVLLGRGLARRRHRSWQAALWLLAISFFGHLFKERDIIDSVVSALPFALLWWKRADFDAAGDPHGPPRARAALMWALGGLYAYGIMATFVHAEVRGGPPFSLGDSFVNVSIGFLGIDPTSHPGRFEHGLTISLASAAIICAAYIAWLALRPRDSAVSQVVADRRDARRLVERHGRDSLAYFALRRDKSYFFNEERTAFLAYRAIGGVALVSGDPVGDPSAAPGLLSDFARHCHAHAWRVAALGVARSHLADWHAIGLRTIYIGDEAVVHPCRFSLEGRPIRKVRQSVTRLRRGGHVARVVRARELTLEQRHDIERVSRTWLRGQPERGFTMALDDMHARDHGDAVFALGYDADSRLVGFVHFVPAPASGDLSLSAMRRLHHTPNGLMEFLLCETFAWAGRRGIERISLNFNAFGDLLRSDAKLPAWERGLRFVLARADRFFQVERLLDFNRKFFPEWEPRYAAFERYSDLPLAALVLLSIESLVAWPGVLRRLWPHASQVPVAPAAGRPA